MVSVTSVTPSSEKMGNATLSLCQQKIRSLQEQQTVFRLDALAKALSVIATATWLGGWLGGWLAGWLAGCPSHSGIVSKRLNVSENFFDHLKAPSF